MSEYELHADSDHDESYTLLTIGPQTFFNNELVTSLFDLFSDVHLVPATSEPVAPNSVHISWANPAVVPASGVSTEPKVFRVHFSRNFQSDFSCRSCC